MLTYTHSCAYLCICCERLLIKKTLIEDLLKCPEGLQQVSPKLYNLWVVRDLKLLLLM